ncbi:MAG: hypothetical protein E3J54_01575, partial [Actinobacteria bacterium]
MTLKSELWGPETNMVMDYLTKVLRFGEGKKLKQLEKQVEQVNELEDEVSKIKDSQFKEKMGELKERHEQGETLELLLPQAFA